MKQRHKSKSTKKKIIALERIEVLFKEAQKQYGSDPKLSNRYVYLARKIAMKCKVKIPSIYRRQYCRHCYSYLMPGKNARVRTTTKTISYYCSNCRKYTRFGYQENKKKTI